MNEETKTTDLSANALDSIFKKAAGKPTVYQKIRRASGAVGAYAKRLKKVLTPREITLEKQARERAANIEKLYSRVGRQRARKIAVARDFAEISAGPGKLDLPRKARRKIARAKAKRSA